MVTRRKTNFGRYLVAFVISASIFVIGLLIGTIFTENKLSSIDKLEQDLRTQVLTVETQYSIASQNPCALIDSDELNSELYKLDSTLSSLETDLGKNNEDVLRLVEYYSLLEVRQWLFVKDASKKCGKNPILILFFYSNNANKCTDCEVQGYVLTFLRKQYPEKSIYVYSFNTDINNTVIKTMMKVYNVKTLPSIVINDKTYEGFKDRNQLEKILNIQ